MCTATTARGPDLPWGSRTPKVVPEQDIRTGTPKRPDRVPQTPGQGTIKYMVVLTGGSSKLSLLARLLELPQGTNRPAPTQRRRPHQHHLSAAEKVAVAQRYQAGAEMRELATAFRVHRTSITHCLRELGIPLRRQGLRAEDLPETARLYEGGWSLAQLGRKYGCAHTTIRLRLMEYGVTMRPAAGVGITNGSCLLAPGSDGPIDVRPRRPR